MYLCIWERTKKIYELCSRILKLQKDILESDESIQKKIITYADLSKTLFDTSYKQTGIVIKYMREIAEAAKAEAQKNVEM